MLLFWQTGSKKQQKSEDDNRTWLVAIQCSTYVNLLACAILIENPTHTTFKECFMIVNFSFLVVSYTEFVFLKYFSEKNQLI